jgi:hypothetical protein
MDEASQVVYVLDAYMLGRASELISSTPIGAVCVSSTRPESSRAAMAADSSTLCVAEAAEEALNFANGCVLNKWLLQLAAAVSCKALAADTTSRCCCCCCSLWPCYTPSCFKQAPSSRGGQFQCSAAVHCGPQTLL